VCESFVGMCYIYVYVLVGEHHAPTLGLNPTHPLLSVFIVNSSAGDLPGVTPLK